MITENNIVKIYNKHLGYFYALKTENAKKAFQNPMQACRSIRLNNDDIVVDIGAYIGEYSIYASNNCKKVISYEASSQIFNILMLNKKDNMEIYNLAVIGDNRPEVVVYLSKGVGATNSIIKKAKKGGTEIIKTINYKEAIKTATVVKIDVEGAEYTYPIIQPNLRAIILEFHPVSEINWIKKAREIMIELQDNGYKPTIKIPEFKHGWDTNSSWVKS